MRPVRDATTAEVTASAQQDNANLIGLVRAWQLAELTQEELGACFVQQDDNGAHVTVAVLRGEFARNVRALRRAETFTAILAALESGAPVDPPVLVPANLVHPSHPPISHGTAGGRHRLVAGYAFLERNPAARMKVFIPKP